MMPVSASYPPCPTVRYLLFSCGVNTKCRVHIVGKFAFPGELWGSKSQCDRAEPIRRRTLSQVDVLARHARIEDRDAFAELRKQVLRMNDAAWWIEHKNDAATTLAQDIEL